MVQWRRLSTWTLVASLAACDAGADHALNFAEGTGADAVTTGGSTHTPATTDAIANSTNEDTDTGFMDVLRFDVSYSGDVASPTNKLAAVVYAHTGEDLYRLDVDALELTYVGTFSGCDNRPTDIAVNANNEIFATSSGNVYSIDPTTARCTVILSRGFGMSLSFVPAGILHPDREILVSYDVRQYNSLDPVDGSVGTYGTLPSDMEVSGDVVSLIDGPTYVTVRGTPDRLVEIDPRTGEMLGDLGEIGTYAEVWGLGFWGGTIYGFASNGALFTVELADTNLRTQLVLDTGIRFFGAGSSTRAPLTPAG